MMADKQLYPADDLVHLLGEGWKPPHIVAKDEEPEDDWQPPSYSETGRILVHVDLDSSDEYDQRYDVLDHDGCTFWINEGVGFDYWLEHEVGGKEVFKTSGLYIINNVVGSYHRGSWGFDDDTEDWSFDPPRKLTLIERFKRWWFARELP